jgi:broad specificity phosphatase PhoE
VRTRQEIVLVRHGETEWSRDGRHTGRTNLPLTDVGEKQAERLGSTLADRTFALVLTSPLQRSRRTCELAGLGGAQVIDDLRELDYGVYEGRTTADIQRDEPGWTVWSAPLVGGETIDEAGARADRVIRRLRETEGDVAVFGHGHILRILGARWCDFLPEAGAHLALDTASISILGYERTTPTIRSWNHTLPPMD